MLSHHFLNLPFEFFFCINDCSELFLCCFKFQLKILKLVLQLMFLMRNLISNVFFDYFQRSLSFNQKSFSFLVLRDQFLIKSNSDISNISFKSFSKIRHCLVSINSLKLLFFLLKSWSLKSYKITCSFFKNSHHRFCNCFI